MRFIPVVILTFFSAIELAALSSGDRAVKLESVTAVKGKTPLLTPYVQDERNAAKLKLLTVGNVWNDNTRGAMPILTDAAQKHQTILLLGNPVGEAKKFSDEFPDFSGVVLSDAESKNVNAYLGESIIQPRSYAIDFRGEIIWDGETAELPLFLSDFAAGKFDPDRQQKFSRLQLQLEKTLRSGNDSEAARVAAKALALYPAHPAILRMRVYMLNSTGRAAAAWELLDEQSKINPTRDAALMKLNLTYSDRTLAPRAASALRELNASRATELEKLSANWSALTVHQFDPEVLDLVYARVMAPDFLSGMEPAALALAHSCRALALYRAGRAADALLEQDKALEADRGNAEMLRLRDFYRRAIERGKAQAE